MTIERSHLLLALALGMFASGLNVGSIFADSGHDHDAMKAEKKISASLASLSAADRKVAEAQRFCPSKPYHRLGMMGAPIKLVVDGKPVFVCCKGCVDAAKKGGQATLTTAKKLTDASVALAKLPTKERAAAESQKYCAIRSKHFLGSMGTPVKLDLSGKPIYLCCKGCTAKAQANPAATLAKVAKLKKAGAKKGHGPGHKH